MPDDTEARRLDPAWRAAVAATRAAVAALGWRIHVEGLENLPPDGPAVLMFNHHSALDGVMLAWGPAVELGRRVRPLVKQELLRPRPLGAAILALGAIPVERGSRTSRGAAFDAAREALDEGDLVALAPERTRSPSFELLPFRTGAVRLAAEADVPLIPCVGWGSQRILRRERLLPRLRGVDVSVRFLPGVDAGGKEPSELTERIRADMESELHDLQESYPGGSPPGAGWVPRRLGGSAPSRDQGEAILAAREAAWEGRG